MIVKENLEISGRAFVKQYSDGGFYIERDGAKYAEAIDPADIPREYTETGEPIESETEPRTRSACSMKWGSIPMISKEKLEKNFEAAKAEYKAGLQLILDSLNQGQRKKLLNNEEVYQLFKRFSVVE